MSKAKAKLAPVARLVKKANPYEVAAARVAEILADETTPLFLLDVLTDMLCDLSNETGVNDTDPEIARILMTKAFPVADEMGLRLMNGSLSREGKAK
jgi:hypothetical protein